MTHLRQCKTCSSQEWQLADYIGAAANFRNTALESPVCPKLRLQPQPVSATAATAATVRNNQQKTELLFSKLPAPSGHVGSINQQCLSVQLLTSEQGQIKLARSTDWLTERLTVRQFNSETGSTEATVAAAAEGDPDLQGIAVARCTCSSTGTLSPYCLNTL